ncbi:hypothetical protein MUG91_G77n162 [Manis pentadactyla]|nr:hypothetical protein MUG91_G77n162 [Manis pentadactyla]
MMKTECKKCLKGSTWVHGTCSAESLAFERPCDCFQQNFDVLEEKETAQLQHLADSLELKRKVHTLPGGQSSTYSFMKVTRKGWECGAGTPEGSHGAGEGFLHTNDASLASGTLEPMQKLESKTAPARLRQACSGKRSHLWRLPDHTRCPRTPGATPCTNQSPPHLSAALDLEPERVVAEETEALKVPVEKEAL